MNISWPGDETRDITNKIRDAVGRDVSFYIVASSYECPVCGINPMTGTAIDPLCLTCSGDGIIQELAEENINAHVTWKYLDNLNWYPGGQVFEGDCRVQIEYTQSNLDIIDITKFIVVDGKQMTINKPIYRGSPINRILLDLIERDKDNE